MQRAGGCLKLTTLHSRRLWGRISLRRLWGRISLRRLPRGSKGDKSFLDVSPPDYLPCNTMGSLFLSSGLDLSLYLLHIQLIAQRSFRPTFCRIYACASVCICAYEPRLCCYTRGSQRRSTLDISELSPQQQHLGSSISRRR